MDSAVALVGADYVLFAADRSAAFSILRFKDDEDKITPIDNNKLLAAAGDAANREDFTDLVQKNIHLYYYRNGVSLSTKGTAHFIRTMISEDLRKAPSFTDLLLGGVEQGVPSLFYLDYLGVLQKMQFGAHGYTSNFLYGLLDHWWKPELNLEQGLELIRKCRQQVATRFLIAQPKFIVKVVDASGARELSLD